MDEATSAVSRGHYVRICVELDLSKPLLARFTLRRRTKRLEYEGIHLICGMFRHRRDSCPLEKKEAAAVSGNHDGETTDRDQVSKDQSRKGGNCDKSGNSHYKKIRI